MKRNFDLLIIRNLINNFFILLTSFKLQNSVSSLKKKTNLREPPPCTLYNTTHPRTRYTTHKTNKQIQRQKEKKTLSWEGVNWNLLSFPTLGRGKSPLEKEAKVCWSKWTRYRLYAVSQHASSSTAPTSPIPTCGHQMPESKA